MGGLGVLQLITPLPAQRPPAPSRETSNNLFQKEFVIFRCFRGSAAPAGA